MLFFTHLALSFCLVGALSTTASVYLLSQDAPFFWALFVPAFAGAYLFGFAVEGLRR